MGKIVLITVAFLLIAYGTILPRGTEAAANSFNFGGRIYYTTLCTCSAPNLYVVVMGPPKGGTFVYVFGASVSYMWYALIEGVAAEGIYTPSTGECWMIAGESCVLWETQGQIRMIGTSLE